MGGPGRITIGCRTVHIGCRPDCVGVAVGSPLRGPTASLWQPERTAADAVSCQQDEHCLIPSEQAYTADS